MIPYLFTLIKVRKFKVGLALEFEDYIIAFISNDLVFQVSISYHFYLIWCCGAHLFEFVQLLAHLGWEYNKTWEMPPTYLWWLCLISCRRCSMDNTESFLNLM
jgi:hypothetical protein